MLDLQECTINDTATARCSSSSNVEATGKAVYSFVAEAFSRGYA